MSETWKSPEYRKNVEEFLNLHPYCSWHGEPVKATVVHHNPKRQYAEEEYVALVDCKGLCNKCHFAVKKHLKLCPICKQHYFKPSRKKGKDRCWECFIKTPLGQNVKSYYDQHPDKLKRKMRK